MGEHKVLDEEQLSYWSWISYKIKEREGIRGAAGRGLMYGEQQAGVAALEGEQQARPVALGGEKQAVLHGEQ
jgi:hypothetical protein